MKILVAIANYGTKNAKYLGKLLKEYRSMTKYKADIIVLSNSVKDFGADVEVIVGLPTQDPYSLPFGYKKILAERKDKYDIFIYSEDDTLLTEHHIDAFLRVTKILPDHFIAGFIRYEMSGDGRKHYPDFHGRFHWDPNSVLKIEDHIFAHHTNEHSACFVLTRRQLISAIDSGGFLLPPRKGRYNMLETAATDPYTQCGMEKLICISHLDDFSIHHLPNVYLDKIGIDSEIVDREIDKLKSICECSSICGPLLDTTTLLNDDHWDKKYYEPGRKDICSLIPANITRVLSIGCGCGSTEFEIINQGIEVVGIPLDCIIAEEAAARGLKLVPSNFEAAMKRLRCEKFNCILFLDVLHHLPDPILVIKTFLNLLPQNDVLIISVPNFHYPSRRLKRLLGQVGYSKALCLPNFQEYKIHFTTKRMLSSWLENCGLEVISSNYYVGPRYEALNRITFGWLKSNLSENIVILARRTPGKDKFQG